MKKRLFLIIGLAILTIGGLKAQAFDFTNNLRVSVGANLGAVGYHLGSGGLNTTYNGFGFGANLSFLGVYLDFMYQTPEHQYAKEVGRDWDDHSALTINIGYQIPITNYLFVTPLIGYSNETYGITRGNKFDVGDHELIHDYDVIERFNHFNYGLGLMVRPISEVEIGCVASAHAIYGTFSYSLGLKN